MAASRAIVPGIRCNGCRSHLLRSFASLAGVDLPARDPHARSLLSAHCQSRAFTTAPLRLSDNVPRPEPRHAEQDAAPASLSDSGSPSQSSNAPDASVPWYLQVDAPQAPLDAASHPLGDRQRIPDLPDHPPPILSEFLEYVSVDLGIDDLSLLDLRHLDPPPALGANLLMLFGTARSEKHLHKSADRLCRWLRSEHSLSPHADGLLGRNELKIKLRRKARKARMLSNAGVSPSSLAADDGIRTGWVCVHVGAVKAADSAPRAAPKVEGFVGFGQVSNSVNIVVQMFTEEKRVELDLETLWNGVLKTDRRRREASTAGETVPEPQASSQNPNGAVLAERTVQSYPSQTQSASAQARLQARAYHTLSARKHGMNSVFERARDTPWANSSSRIRGASVSTITCQTASLHDGAAPSRLLDVATSDQNDQAIALANLLEHLYQMPPEKKHSLLGKGPGRRREDITPFMKDFYSRIPEFPDILHFEALLQLYLSALSINHPGYGVENIHHVLQDMQAAGLRVPERMFLSALRAILSRENPFERSQKTGSRRNEIVFALLDSMQAHSYPVLTDEIILMLHDSVSTLPTELAKRHPNAEVAKKRARYNTTVRRELLNRIDMLALPLKAETFGHLLRSYAALGDMEGLWHVWKATALHMHPRSPQMYADALNAVSVMSNQVECSDTLQNCVASMEKEIPPVELKGGVAEAVMRCLLVVEPGVKAMVARGATDGEWAKLWLRCQEALESEDDGDGDGGSERMGGFFGQFRANAVERP